MSNYWDIHCEDCKVDFGISNANHGDDLMRSLIKARDALAALAESHVPYSDFEVQAGSIHIPVRQFAKHVGHKLVAVDEYGRRDEDCGEWFKCKCCGHSQTCALKKDHGGEHEVRP